MPHPIPMAPGILAHHSGRERLTRALDARLEAHLMGLALGLLVLLLLPLRAGAEPSQAEAEMRRKVAGWAKGRHYRRETPEPDRIVAEALTQGNREPLTPAFDDWSRARLSTAFYAFAPSFAV